MRSRENANWSSSRGWSACWIFPCSSKWRERGLKLCGYTGLINDARGQFQANFAEPHHHKRIPAKVVSLFREPPDISTRLLEFYGDVFAALEDGIAPSGFRRADRH